MKAYALEWKCRSCGERSTSHHEKTWECAVRELELRLNSGRIHYCLNSHRCSGNKLGMADLIGMCEVEEKE